MTGAEMLTEAEAWREIARRFAEGDADAGMCWEIVDLRLYRRITFGQQKAMKRRIDTHAALSWIWEIEDGQSTGPWAFDSHDREVRVLAALFLALEAEDEEALNEPCEACGEIHGYM